MQFAELLRKHLAGILGVTEAQIEALTKHYALLEQWNQRLNLTAIRNMEDAVIRHYCESLFFACHLLEAGSILDLGSGAGFPGIPMAIWRPEWRITLAESHQRKAVFLREASRTAANVRVLAKRAEDVAERFDWVISRAVSYEDLLPYLQKLAPNAELLSGGEAPPQGMGFLWAPAVLLPWGDQRFLWTGHVLNSA